MKTGLIKVKECMLAYNIEDEMSEMSYEAEFRWEIVGPFIWVSSFDNKNRGDGSGKSAILQLQGKAKELGMAILLHPWSPWNEDQLGLEGWYSHFGFREDPELECWVWK